MRHWISINAYDCGYVTRTNALLMRLDRNSLQAVIRDISALGGKPVQVGAHFPTGQQAAYPLWLKESVRFNSESLNLYKASIIKEI